MPNGSDYREGHNEGLLKALNIIKKEIEFLGGTL